MDVILFGSPLNPLSAIAADYFKKNHSLKLIVLPKNVRIDFRGGLLYFCSQVCVALYRYFFILMRMGGMKRSRHYSCLLEFIKNNKSIPVIYYQQGSRDLDQQIFSIVGDTWKDDFLIFSCIFPFKIPLDLKKNKYLVNMHPGILPENRGPNPYFWALATQMKRTGITFHILTDKMDEGSILFQKATDITATFSEYRLEKLSGELMMDALPVFINSLKKFWANASPQEEGTYFKAPGRDERRRYKRNSVFRLRDFFE